MLREFLISELRDSLMCCPSAPAGYLLLAERLHYKGCVLFLACPRLYNDCYFRIGKMKILTPPDSNMNFKIIRAGRMIAIIIPHYNWRVKMDYKVKVMHDIFYQLLQ